MGTLKTYQDFFKRVGLPVKSNEELNAMLKQAVVNSWNKKYHGEVDDVVGLGTLPEQTKSYTDLTSTLTDFIADGKVREDTEAEWKERVLARWKWIGWYIHADYTGERTPQQIARFVDTFDHHVNIVVSDFEDVKQHYHNTLNQPFLGKQYKPTIVEDYPEEFTWRELYTKMDIELSVRLLNYSQDFKDLYARVTAASPLLRNFTLFITPVKDLKSGYYYLCSVLSRLKYLRILRIMPSETDYMPYKALNNIRKGMNNLKKAGACSIE